MLSGNRSPDLQWAGAQPRLLEPIVACTLFRCRSAAKLRLEQFQKVLVTAPDMARGTGIFLEGLLRLAGDLKACKTLDILLALVKPLLLRNPLQASHTLHMDIEDLG